MIVTLDDVRALFTAQRMLNQLDSDRHRDHVAASLYWCVKLTLETGK